MGYHLHFGKTNLHFKADELINAKGGQKSILQNKL